ncbi:MAG: hypothetical protein Q9182_006358 [Xanthomendoza sp. 2 TL-2023]
MMMNPRAYSLSTSPSQHLQRKSRNGVSATAERSGTRPVDSKKPMIRRDLTTRPAKTIAISSAAPSKPVVIPTRTKTDRRHGRAFSRGEQVEEDARVSLDFGVVSSSDEALFAMPSSQGSRHKKGLGQYRKSHPVHFQAELAEALGDSQPSSASSPHSWKTLLSPPQEMDEDVETLGHLSSLRSFSSESMPSLDTDTESTYTSSSPSTPGPSASGRGLRDRRMKNISSSVPEDCKSDHPLLIVRPDAEHAADSSVDEFEANEDRLPSSTRPSLRSNLTASLRRLKTAAKTLASLSTITTSAPQNETPTRATLSRNSQFTDERRPLPWAEPPDPALRRYLNPITVSPAEFYTHREREERRPSRRGCTASIQMQPYRPGARKSEKASAPPVFLAASSTNGGNPPNHRKPAAPSPTSSSRHREPRENSDFLRVIVLEMNMRKTGKLSDAAPGRARLWLPARQVRNCDYDDDNDEKGNEIPRRWMAIYP